MEFKSIDSLSITECCEQLNLRREDLPDAMQDLHELTERDRLLIARLELLLSEDKSAVESCRTIEQYEGYFSTWTDGLYHDYAKTRIAQLKAEAEEYAFYKTHKDSIWGCEEYLQKYPNGKFVNDVQPILLQKKKTNKVCIIIIFLLLLLAAGAFACYNYVPVSYISVADNAELNNLGSEITLSISTDAINSTISATSSEDWINCRVSGQTLYISGITNPKEKRNATITVTAHSSFFGRELSDKKQTTITVSQETGYATHLSLVNDEIYLSANGGKESLSINTDGIFAVSTAPASWVTTSINGKTLNLEYAENPGIVRVSHLIIKSGSKTKRLNITQAGKSATRLDVSTSNVEFSADGGSRTIEIYTDGECKISTQPESWAHATINGKSVSISVDMNGEDETTGWHGTSRTSYLVIKSGTYEKRINISQAGLFATYLNASPENVSFSYSGGSRTITVSTDGEWQISTGTAEWGLTSISGNIITLMVGENTSTSPRTDYFVVKSGSKEKRINISQDGKPVTRLSVSTENVSFGKDGGRRTITVSTNGEWEIGVGTASWAHTSISGNIITLRVDENDSGDERTDYFTVVAGDKNVRIDITQAGGPSAEVNSIRVEHNITRTGYNSVIGPWGWQQVPYTYNVMRIHVDFDVENMKGKTIYVCAFFYDEDGNKMMSSNNNYRTSDGQVTVQSTATPRYESSNWSDFVLEIPYSVIKTGVNKFVIEIQDNNGDFLGESDYEYFTRY